MIETLELLKYAPFIGAAISWFAGVATALMMTFAVCRSVR